MTIVFRSCGFTNKILVLTCLSRDRESLDDKKGEMIGETMFDTNVSSCV